MHRFIVRAAALEHDSVTLDGAHGRQIAVVLRMQPGDEITLVSGGAEAIAVIESVEPDHVIARIRERGGATNEPKIALTLGLPLLRGDRSEEVVEAVTQLGASRIVPFTSARSVVRSLSGAKRSRWERIAREAAETARRGRVPKIEEPHEWEKLFDVLHKGALVAWEGEALRRFRDALPRSDMSLVVGPEGGLRPDEIEFARERGAVTVSLGPRNLRSETAAIAAVAQAVAALDR